MPNEYTYSGMSVSAIDDKGRLSIPVAFRKSVIDSSYGERDIFIGLDEKWSCLIGFGLSRKDNLLAEIEKEAERALALGKEYDEQAAQARKYSSIEKMHFDAGGRFVLPEKWRKMGRLKNEALMHGNGRVFCIWNPDVLLEAIDKDAGTPREVPLNRMMVEYTLEEAREKKK